jgi:hypothetical protein
VVTPDSESPPAVHPDELSRLHKMVLDSGEAVTREQAKEYFAGFRLQIVLGDDAVEDPALHASILTAVNTGARAFPGGVTVIVSTDFACAVAWHHGFSLTEACTALGATVAEHGALIEGIPTIVFGATHLAVTGRPLVYAASLGWVACVSDRALTRSRSTPPIPPASVLAGALAVSEAFQAHRGDPFAGRRSVGLSLWRPDLDFRNPGAVGPALEYLFSEAWLIGLGHLGQAFAWVLGTLPLEPEFNLMLQDTDRIESPNLDTSLLAHESDLGTLKTRLVARRFDRIGIDARLCERLLDSHQRLQGDEPRLAFVGLDKPEPRRHLDDCGFHRVIDLGLGAGPRDYLGIQLNRLPASRTAHDIFKGSYSDTDRRAQRLLDTQPAYKRMVRDQGQCGTLQVARRTVATSFVGAAAASMGVADALRSLHGGEEFELLSMSLDNPSAVLGSGAARHNPLTMPSSRQIGS